jgi:hypothetical protein
MLAEELVRILPLILRLFPELATSPLIGKIIPLFKIDPRSDTDLARALNRELKVPKHHGFNDNTAVIKVSEAIKCVETKLGNGKVLLSFLKGIVNSLKSAEGKNAAELLASDIAACIREDSLRQNTPRTTDPPRQKYHRPAKGHGKGRGKF